MAVPLPLHDAHQQLGARFTEENGYTYVAAYGAVEDEYRAIREAAGLYDRSHRSKLKLTGSERESYLQGMVTNDVVKPPVGRGAYVAMLTVKGRMVADGRVLKRAEELLIDMEPGRAEPASEFLDKFLISEDAEIHDVTGDWSLFSFVGPRAAEVLSAVLGTEISQLEEYEIREVESEGGTMLVVGTNLVGSPGLDVWVASTAGAAFLSRALEKGRAAGLAPVGLEAMEIARVEAGLPRYGVDMTEETIPLEANLERAIAYDKGCYIGQEVIARATYRGQMNRKLVGLSFADGEVPARQTKLFKDPADARPIGVITTAVKSPLFPGPICLGYVRRELLTPGTELKTESGRVARVEALPYTPPA